MRTITITLCICCLIVLMVIAMRLVDIHAELLRHNDDSVRFNSKLVHDMQELQSGSIARLQKDVSKVSEWVDTERKLKQGAMYQVELFMEQKRLLEERQKADK